MVVTSESISVEYAFTAGSAHDLDGMKQLPLNLPPGSDLMGDSAYIDYLLEKMLQKIMISVCLPPGKPIPDIPVRSLCGISDCYTKKTRENCFFRYR
jgi:hypothetical protein